jgi:hypothetical protein
METSTFWNVVYWTKPRNPVILGVIHLHRNPLASIYIVHCYVSSAFIYITCFHAWSYVLGRYSQSRLSYVVVWLLFFNHRGCSTAWCICFCRVDPIMYCEIHISTHCFGFMFLLYKWMADISRLPLLFELCTHISCWL